VARTTSYTASKIINRLLAGRRRSHWSKEREREREREIDSARGRCTHLKVSQVCAEERAAMDICICRGIVGGWHATDIWALLVGTSTMQSDFLLKSINV